MTTTTSTTMTTPDATGWSLGWYRHIPNNAQSHIPTSLNDVTFILASAWLAWTEWHATLVWKVGKGPSSGCQRCPEDLKASKAVWNREGDTSQPTRRSAAVVKWHHNLWGDVNMLSDSEPRKFFLSPPPDSTSHQSHISLQIAIKHLRKSSAHHNFRGEGVSRTSWTL